MQTKYLRPDAEAVSGALFPAIIELRYWAEVHALEEYLLSVGGAVTEGTTAQSVVSLARMLAAVLRTAPRTVCEIGVNGGHSSLLWLLAVPAARVVAFDLGIHRCVVPAARWLTRRFPGRYTLVLGDSLEEVPAFHAAHPDGAWWHCMRGRCGGDACMCVFAYGFFLRWLGSFVAHVEADAQSCAIFGSLMAATHGALWPAMLRPLRRCLVTARRSYSMTCQRTTTTAGARGRCGRASCATAPWRPPAPERRSAGRNRFGCPTTGTLFRAARAASSRRSA